MAEQIDASESAPAASEAIHLPGPSFLPVILAAGIMIALVGIVLNWVVFGLGVAVALYALLRWIGQMRAEIADLPLEHERH